MMKYISEFSPSIQTTKYLLYRLVCALFWVAITHLSLVFSVNVAVSMSEAGRKTFIPATYKYDADFTVFDNTFLTYGTDYMLCWLMLYGAHQCYYAGINDTKQANACSLQEENMLRIDTNITFENNPIFSLPLRRKSAALLICYAVSVFAGGYAHQKFLSFESLNTAIFRSIWTICVGSVTMAGGFMGMVGSEICRKFLHANIGCNSRFSVPIIPDVLWYIYGFYMTVVCGMGGISYMRPACDIFVAGTTQFIPTMYCELVLLIVVLQENINMEKLSPSTTQVSQKERNEDQRIIPKLHRYAYFVGFVLNAPLLPCYPLLIQYTQWPLGIVNLLLHLNLMFAWGMQSMGLRRICIALNYCERFSDSSTETIIKRGDKKCQ